MAINIPHDRVLKVLSSHIGENNGINASSLAQACVAMAPHVNGCATYDVSFPVCERSLRQSILELRLKGHHICGTPNSGYFIAKNAREMHQTLQFLMSRAMTSLRQISAMKNIALPDLYGQMNIPYELDGDGT